MKVLVALSLLAVAFAGCTAPESDFVVPEQDSEGRYVIELTSGSRFVPDKAEVPAGSVVVFVNTGGVHDVRSDSGAWQNSPMMSPGDEYEVTVDTPGDYGFFCSPHKAAGMTGTLRVV